MQPDYGKLQGPYQGYFQRGTMQIQKGANPERAARIGYNKTCDYLDILDKRIHIQQIVFTPHSPDGNVQYG